MNNSSNFKTIYRKDYQPYPFEIESLQLDFDLHEENTIVHSYLKIRRKPHSTAAHLHLDGEELHLQSILLNQHVLSQNQYELTDKYLEIKDVPDEFSLEIVVTIQPQNNTQLSGLYKSSGIFCTQCEAEGFRRITFYPDRPDVLTRFTTTITADPNLYSSLLSNGNLVEQHTSENGRLQVKWEDPFKKPCYLFALVAGQLDKVTGEFITMNQRSVQVEIYVEPGYLHKAHFALEAAQRAMRWDEQRFGREYDLDRYMIVAINDFNMGAMENKGLNIFNTKYVLADDLTATDVDYQHILAVIGHEYFHNWSGNRVTCRDWFQLSLKEGLTVYRDQEFSSDELSRTVQRIQNVRQLKTYQFPEDAGPMAHPVRPDSYIEINNFYTQTVYEKGAEVIRMMETLVGQAGFRKGMDLYFERHDGQAVTVEDFVLAMEAANQIDLGQFRLWYSQAGTPHLDIQDEYDASQQRYSITFRQTCPATPNQPEKQAFAIPVKLGLLNAQGKEIPWNYQGRTAYEHTVVVNQTEQVIFVEAISEKPIPSFLRDFSAPIILHYAFDLTQLLVLMESDPNLFNRWEAAQHYFILEYQRLAKLHQQNQASILNPSFIAALKYNLNQEHLDPAFLAEFLQFPSEKYLASLLKPVDIETIHLVRKAMIETIAVELEYDFVQLYQRCATNKPYLFDVISAAQRSLKNSCLAYLMRHPSQRYHSLAWQQYQKADNMTDRYAALANLAHSDTLERQQALEHFYQNFQSDALVIDKWFTVQALSTRESCFDDIVSLSQHPDFSIRNPNRFRSLISVFCSQNQYHFHRKDGKAYALLANYVLQLNQLNPQIAARAVEPLTHWKDYDSNRQELMQAELRRILAEPKLATDVYEIVSKSLSF